ncbi:hypothetical protein BH10ACT7_BH10ACT7_20800 [soil metagenome]
MLGLFGLLSIGVLVPIPVTDAWLGGTNIIFLFRTLFPVAAFWFLRDAVALQARRPRRRNFMLIALFAMVVAQTWVFFSIPYRGSTSIEFVDEHMIYVAGLLWAFLYAGQVIYIAGDIIRMLWSVRRTLFAAFIVGAGLTITGALSLIAHCVLIFQGVVDPVSGDLAWILFNMLFYPGILLMVLGFLSFVLADALPAAMWRYRAWRLRRILLTNGPTLVHGGVFAGALSVLAEADPIQDAYEAAIALRNAQLLGKIELGPGESRQLRGTEVGLDKRLRRTTP